MKQLFAFCLLGAMFASCNNTEETKTTEATDSAVVTAAAPVDTVVASTDSTTVTVAEPAK